MNRFNDFQLGSFLKFDMWIEAKKLLDFQIKQMDKNKHYNTLSMFYYKRVFILPNSIDTEEYFEQRVANSLLYAFEKEFAFYDYVVPKSHLGLRNQKFFTYPMRITYYSLGLYLLKLSQDFLESYYKNNRNLKCYYGGNLSFNNNFLNIKHESTFYKSYYKKFKKHLRRHIEKDVDNKLIIKLDIQNFFDNISIPLLINLLDEYVKPSIQEELNFNTSTKEQIKFLFNHISSNKGGIPQADNDIISSFLGYLYLTFSDLLIDSEINSYQNSIQKHQIIRYVDDIYLVICFSKEITESQKENIADSITSHVSDLLYFKLHLKLNSKTRLYWLNQKEDRNTLLKDLKKVSPEYHLNDEDNDETPENKVINIFHELEKLKNTRIEFSICSDGSIESDILKEVYDKTVNQLLTKQENQKRIEEIFTCFNFDLVKVMPREIIVIMCKNKKVSGEFIRFLQEKGRLSSRDIHLILILLCQTEFENTDLFQKIKTVNTFKQIINLYENPNISSDLPGYFHLPYQQTFIIKSQTNIIEQIRLRVFSEKIDSYSVALNHLLNEIHAICIYLDTPNNKNKYEADDVVNYLKTRFVPHDICVGIRNLFDRRNRNTISHPSSDNKVAWGVKKEEYFEYREAVGRCLKLILLTSLN
jgi:AbiA family abortive infection protein